MKKLFLISMLLAAGRLQAATYYLSPSGSDTTGTGSSVAPFRTSTKAFTLAVAGDTVIWKDGTYTYSGGNISNPPSGSAGNYLILKAENDGGAILKGYNTAVAINAKSYIQLEGFTIKDGIGAHAIVITDSHHIKVMRVGIKNGAAWNTTHASIVQLSSLDGVTGTTDCLLEDVWVVGVMRYGILIGGSAAYSERNILRRCVVRFDGSGSGQPHAGISNYGVTTGIQGARNNLVQNCITIDFNPADNPTGEGIYAGFFNPHAATNIDFYGCIALKTRERGWLLNGDIGSTGNDMYHCVVWQPSGDGIVGQRGTSPGSILENVTVGASLSHGYVSWNGAAATIRNSLFYGNGSANSGVTLEEYNHYWNNSVTGTNALSTNPLMKYITQIEANSPAYQSGKNGATRGATIVKRYGVSGTLYGEAGYDALTADNLWPFPYQQRIKDLFAEPDGNSNMPNNNEQRGFAAGGQTLTKYIWEYLGTPDPNATDVTDTVRPTIISATAVNATTVNVVFSESLEAASSQAAANYSISNSVIVNSAILASDNRTVTLTVSELVSGASYTLTISNVNDRASPANTILANSAVTFTYAVSVPDSGGSGNSATTSSPDGLKPGQQVLGSNGTIQFGNDAAQVVVHDSRGNVVYSGSKSGGAAIVWDGTDGNGRSVRSGAYTSKIIGADGRVVYSMIMVVK